MSKENEENANTDDFNIDNLDDNNVFDLGENEETQQNLDDDNYLDNENHTDDENYSDDDNYSDDENYTDDENLESGDPHNDQDQVKYYDNSGTEFNPKIHQGLDKLTGKGNYKKIKKLSKKQQEINGEIVLKLIDSITVNLLGSSSRDKGLDDLFISSFNEVQQDDDNIIQSITEKAPLAILVLIPVFYIGMALFNDNEKAKKARSKLSKFKEWSGNIYLKMRHKKLEKIENKNNGEN
jgi:hypothetical protein